jgi:hypothetical protein
MPLACGLLLMQEALSVDPWREGNVLRLTVENKDFATCVTISCCM